MSRRSTMRRVSLVIMTLLAAGACGGSQANEAHHEEHAGMPAEVKAFHDRLAPLWHANPGDERTNATCDAVDELKQRAGDIVIAPTPAAAAADETGYRDAASALVHAVVTLGEACAADGRPEFADRFSEVHDAFHAVLARASP